jgi:hypothetical protein
LKLEININLRRAIVLALIFNGAIALSGFYARTYDSYGHMFFAAHYQSSWFNTWEPKWYTGFNVASYPPLAHQVLALLGSATGLESAYVVINLLLMVLLPIAIFKFAKVFISEEEAGYAALVSVFFPGILFSVYVWGQYTTIFSLVVTLVAIPAFYNFIKKGGVLTFAILICVFEAAIASHHFTGLIFAPLLLAMAFIAIIFKREITLKNGLKRLALFAGVGLALSMIIVYPVLMGAVIPNVDIPHPTTFDYLQNTNLFQIFFTNMYGFFLILIPMTGVLVCFRKALAPLFVLGVFLLILGLGGTTPLPQLVFEQSWTGLTYERFNIFAIVVFAPLFGAVCLKLKGRKIGKIFLVGFLVLCVLFAAFAANESFFRARPQAVPIDSLVNFLNNDEHWTWRYLTLGFDASDFGKLSLYSNATTIDGWYYRGRDLPEFENSRMGFINDAREQENGLAVLSSILQNASQYHLRFVFCNDNYYEPLLNASGFSKLDQYYWQVTLWIKSDSAPLNYSELTNTNHPTTFFDYAWGIIPMSYLAGFLIFSLASFMKAKETAIDWEGWLGKVKRR